MRPHLQPIQMIMPSSQSKSKGGRPSTYSTDIADKICERLASGESLVVICQDKDMPCKTAVYSWLQKHPEFTDKYVRAREAQADTHVDEIVHIADTEEDPQKARVRIDARKWVAGKQRPKKYGDKSQIELTGQNGGALKIERIERVIVDPDATDTNS